VDWKLTYAKCWIAGFNCSEKSAGCEENPLENEVFDAAVKNTFFKFELIQ
jgi:hypothetical protein